MAFISRIDSQSTILQTTKVSIPLRDYSIVKNRLYNLSLPPDIIGTVKDYPIYSIHLESQSENAKNILVTGGVHGDEPAGLKAALHFLERDNSELLQRFSFVVIPCINPYGYVHNVRENKEKVDINRSFEQDDVLEAKIVKNSLEGQQFSFAIDFHEDFEATGFYLYEGQRDESYVGPEIVDAVKRIGPIDTDDSGEDTSEIVQGVYKVASKWGTQGLAPYLLHFHSEHVIITETPTIWPLEQRVELHLGVLDAALTYYL